MSIALDYRSSPPRVGAIAVTLALHLLLLLAWLSLPVRGPDAGKSTRLAPIQWLLMPPAPRPERPPAEFKPKWTKRVMAPIQDFAPPEVPSPPKQIPTPVTTTAPPPAPAKTQPRSADDILQQAKRDIGKIDRELRAAAPPSKALAPADTPQNRLAAGIEAATAPAKWYEAPKIVPVGDQGGYDRRIYKIISGGSTYCITVESNHAPDGLDIMRDGIKQKITTCPREK